MRDKKHIFRYDNSDDKIARDIETYPEHKHMIDGNIIAARNVNLVKVIEEIKTYLG